MSEITKFDRSRNKGVGTCDYCGKKTWKSRMENGHCDRCEMVLEYDNMINDSGPSDRVIKEMKDLINDKNYPPFDLSLLNGRTKKLLGL